MLKEIIQGVQETEIGDKNLVIVCATAIALVAMSLMGESALGLAANVVSGLFGVAVGKTFSKP